ncbi:hypothetical protein FSP39_020767 [Pinctada imbricata]|uniref:Fibrinogen C-terminal domain-containing protein n=1 Tax=Pinctada imbricata TaxID=66713 RepID=A0AA88XL27_PINIB|nr:hypothetical protein FSP39_020767 [Pinctada imbricata]
MITFWFDLLVLVKDCNDLHRSNKKAPSGVYSISPSGGKTYQVYCDMATAGGGWTVIQKRIDGSLDFYKTWKEYKDGFGSVKREYWLGNEAIHALTSVKKRDVYIKIQGRGRYWTYATYTGFYVDSENNKYKLTFNQGSYKGNAGDHLNQKGPGDHNGMKFSTKDVDNDLGGGRSCAHILKGGWWFNNCEYGCLNCKYGNSDSSWGGQGVITGTWMMIR